MRYFELPSNYTHNPGESHEAYELIFLERGLFLDTSETPTVTMKPGDAVVYGQHYFHRTVCDGKKLGGGRYTHLLLRLAGAQGVSFGQALFQGHSRTAKAARKHTVAYAKGVGHQFARM